MSDFKIIKDKDGHSRLLNINTVCRVTDGGEVQSLDGLYFTSLKDLDYLAGFFKSGCLTEVEYDKHIKELEIQ